MCYFTDINLRGQKRACLELAEKAVEFKPNLAVLYTTGRDVRPPRGPHRHFLPKPYSSSQLADGVHGLLKAR